MNEYQKLRFARQIVDSMLGSLRGKKIVLFGFAFKKNTGKKNNICPIVRE